MVWYFQNTFQVQALVNIDIKMTKKIVFANFSVARPVSELSYFDNCALKPSVI
jgi:hypothetical protein